MSFQGNQENAQAWPLAAHLPRFLKSGQVAIDYMLQHVPKNELAFRWIGKETLAEERCVDGVGIFSRGQGNNLLWQKDRIVQHLHQAKGDFQSEYLSMSTSPQRIVNFMVNARDSAEGEIAVVNMEILRLMKCQFESTTALADLCGLRTGGNDIGRIRYVTDTHLLVHEVIPASCILGFINAEVFRQICIYKGINEQTDPRGQMKLEWLDLDGFVSKESRFSIDPQFISPHTAAPRAPMTPPASNRHQGGVSGRQRHHFAPSSSETPQRANVQTRDSDIIDLTRIEIITLEDDPFT